MGSGSFEPPEFNKTGFISNIQVHVKNENPPREPDFEACADFPASFQAKLLGNTGNPYHLAIMNGGPNLSPFIGNCMACVREAAGLSIAKDFTNDYWNKKIFKFLSLLLRSPSTFSIARDL
ncbi:hypothetical protein NC652_030262 [Populus alba x Populus x berolinensis]|nr:hypothetical protein NC652_030262 [Populus alba x Populus x berolinensis]